MCKLITSGSGLFVSILSLAMLFAYTASGQQSKYIYTFPVDQARYINPEQNIILKCNGKFDFSSIKTDQIFLTGSESGTVIFEVFISDNEKTLFIKPEKKFEYGETIYTSIPAGIKTISNNELPELNLSFTIKSADNKQLLQDYYDRFFEERQYTSNHTTNREHQYTRSDDMNLPDDYPAPDFVIEKESDNQYIFFTVGSTQNNDYNPYITIWDKYGTPVFYQRVYGRTLNFYKLNDGRLTYGTSTGLDVSTNKYILMDSACNITDTLLMGNGYTPDLHDMILLENNNYLMMAYDPQIVDMSQIIPGGKPNAVVTGLIIQEVDLNRNVYFQWRSWDHFEITDATSDIDLTASSIDYCHGNAFKIDNDGNILLSSRNMDEITKINSNNGEIIWRFGKNAKNNQFTINNDPLGFSHQHDIIPLGNNHYTIYDNGNLHTPRVSQALEYIINGNTLTATLVWSYRHDPDVFAHSTGSYRRLDNKNNLIGWGWHSPLAVTEVNYDKEIVYEILLPEQTSGYRTVKSDWKTNKFTTPHNINFMNYAGHSGPVIMPLKIQNNTNYYLELSSSHNRQNEFWVEEEFPIGINGNETKTIKVYFEPDSTGYYKDFLTLNHDNHQNTKRISRQVFLFGYWDVEPPTVELTPEEGSVDISLDTIVQCRFSEKVLKINGDEITNQDIRQMFYFKEDDEDGADVPFFGEINDKKTLITLWPISKLKQDQQYYVELKSHMVKDRAGYIITQPQKTTFTTLFYVGIDFSEEKEILVYPNPFDEEIHILPDQQGNFEVHIFSINGKLIMHKHLNKGELSIPTKMLLPGIYYLSLIHNKQLLITKKILKTNTK